MAQGYDGKELVSVLKMHLPSGATVLELGMGPGKDLDLLGEAYIATGSDSSTVFLERFQKIRPRADLLKLDAATLETERTFDCIYSNKVLHHLSRSDLCRSFERQRQLLTDDGLLMHSFWHGDREEEHHGLRFVYYHESAVLRKIGPGFDVVTMNRYREIEEGDSFYVLLRKA